MPSRQLAGCSMQNKLVLDRSGAALGARYRIGLYLTVVEGTSRQI